MNPSSRPPSRLAVALNLTGVVVVGWSLIRTHSEHRPLWVLVVGLLSILAWAARAAASTGRLRRTALVLAVVGALAGAATAAPTDGILVVPAVASLMALVGDDLRPLWHGLALAAAVLVAVPLGAVPFGTPVLAVLAMMGGAVLGVFAGLSRRQYRRAEAQSAELRERELAMREEAARVAIARDLHDVLAHSLGGLVIQLDAADALLEAGDAAAARTRVVDARGLAAEGLAEARRAVAALRDPAVRDDRPVGGAELEAALGDLVAAHRSLGGGAEFTVSGERRELSSEQAAALQRALQEALSNARKHAPGSPVDARLDWQTDRVRLTVENPLTSGHPALARSGGGHGLEGMRERFSALPLGGSATAGEGGGRFTVAVEAGLGPAGPEASPGAGRRPTGKDRT